MRTPLFIVGFLLLLTSAQGQSIRTSSLPTSIKEVTVFIKGALVTRSGELQLSPGKSELTIASLSPHIDEKSIQVNGIGDFTILSVNHQLNYLSELKKNEQIETLLSQQESLEAEMASNYTRLSILKEKENLLDVNKKLGSDNAGASLDQLREAIEFYDQQLTKIKQEASTIKTTNKKLLQTKTKIEQQVASLRNQKDQPTGEIKVRIEVPKSTLGQFKVSYLVSEAGWFPKYDIRVENVEQPLTLHYKADVFQNSGVDWEDVMIKLSNGEPNQSSVAPTLNPWYLSYARNTLYGHQSPTMSQIGIKNVTGKVVDERGEPIPGVNIIVKGTTIGTVSDLNGNYQITLPNHASTLVFSFIGFSTREVPITSSDLSIRMSEEALHLDEVVSSSLQGKASGVLIRGYSSIQSSDDADFLATAVIENQTTVEFLVTQPYSIKSNGEKLSVDLKQYDIAATYQYFAIPKLDTDAFLMARVTDWDQYNLLEGEANLYFEGAYVGRSILDAKSLSDTLSISLGRDKSIVIGRKKVDTFSKTKTLGSNRVDSRGFEILIRNKKNQDINLILTDQIPVAVLDDILVTPNELSGGSHDPKTGKVTWSLNLEAQEQKELSLSYVVKYPKRERVLLE